MYGAENIWNISTEELMMQHQVTKEGLTSQQVDRIRQEKGENILQEGKRKVFSGIYQSVRRSLVVILIVAAVISMFSGNVESTIVILLVLVMNAVLGTIQHVKAQRSLESLNSCLLPVQRSSGMV